MMMMVMFFWLKREKKKSERYKFEWGEGRGGISDPHARRICLSLFLKLAISTVRASGWTSVCKRDSAKIQENEKKKMKEFRYIADDTDEHEVQVKRRRRGTVRGEKDMGSGWSWWWGSIAWMEGNRFIHCLTNIWEKRGGNLGTEWLVISDHHLIKSSEFFCSSLRKIRKESREEERSKMIMSNGKGEMDGWETVVLRHPTPCFYPHILFLTQLLLLPSCHPKLI